jgi:hypothetical protein
MALPTSGKTATSSNSAKITENLVNAVLAFIDESNGTLSPVEAVKLLQGTLEQIVARVEGSHE